MDLVKDFLDKGILLSPGVVGKVKKKDLKEITKKMGRKVVVTGEVLCAVRGTGVEILREHKKLDETKRITEFVDFYNKRFEFLRGLLEEKLEIEKITSINKLNTGRVTVIGMVREINDKGFKIEDSTGSVFCRSDERLLEDEVVAVAGNFDRKDLCAEKIIYPDIPLNKKINLTKEDCRVLFTKKLTKEPSHEPSHIFTFDLNPEILGSISAEIITKKEGLKKGPGRTGLGLPSLLEISGVKIFVFENKEMEEIKKKTEIKDEKNLITSLLKRRHLLPHVYTEGDPYLLKDIPDIIFFSGGKESFFLNYKGVSIVSVAGKESFLVNLKTRDYEELE